MNQIVRRMSGKIPELSRRILHIRFANHLAGQSNDVVPSQTIANTGPDVINLTRFSKIFAFMLRIMALGLLV